MHACVHTSENAGHKYKEQVWKDVNRSMGFFDITKSFTKKRKCVCFSQILSIYLCMCGPVFVILEFGLGCSTCFSFSVFRQSLQRTLQRLIDTVLSSSSSLNYTQGEADHHRVWTPALSLFSVDVGQPFDRSPSRSVTENPTE